MLDLSFSPHNFETIFDIECRKRDMKDYMSPEYSSIVDKISLLNKQLKSLKNKKQISLTTTEKNQITALEDKIKDAQKRKEVVKSETLYKYSKIINSKTFSISLKEIDRTEGVYSLDKTVPELFFLSKKLQYNLRKVFDVKQSSRHLILSQLKLLLNEDTPRYVIKTDITKFYESIPQEKLLKLILEHRSLDAKTKAFIKDIIMEYEKRKDTSLFKPNFGVPRGIGISAYLSEIYLAELDNYVKNYNGVVYYARYVDDIMIVMHKTTDSLKPNIVYADLDKKFYSYGLKLKAKSDKKVSLLDLTNRSLKVSVPPKIMNYLGYRIDINRCDGTTKTDYGISENKKDKIKERISKSIEYFNTESKYNIAEAKHILFASLKLLTSNIKLSGSKSRVKAGIYYSNSLLDNIVEIDGFDEILNEELKKLNPHYRLFSSVAVKEQFVKRLKKQIISAANFKRGFSSKRIYKINEKTRKIILKIWRRKREK